MIRVRDDDVLLPSSSYDDELGRLKQIHEWLCEVPERFIHVPTILITEIQQFPEAIEFIRQETAEGRMLPEIHGWEHVDYAKIDYFDVVTDLDHCSMWIEDNLGYTPTKWYSPWGAGDDEAGSHLREAAAEVNLELITCGNINKLNGRYGVVRHLMDGGGLSRYDEKEIFIHWWEGGSRLKRIVEVAKHGSWEAAAEANKKLFKG